jgi:hypothetical protein
LNKNIGSWYVLDIRNKDQTEETYNILAAYDDVELRIDSIHPQLLVSRVGITYKCDIEKGVSGAAKKLRGTNAGHVFICDDLLLLKFKQDGFQTTLEKGVEAVRLLLGENGETIINVAKESVFRDKYLEDEGEQHLQESPKASDGDASLPRALIHEKYLSTSISTVSLGLKPANSENQVLVGAWYPLKNFTAIYASMITPGMVSQDILRSHLDRVNPLDGVENKAVVYLMALDLSKYTIGWAHGTNHPGVGWSVRAKNIRKDNPLGPDGFNSVSPLILSGHVPPSLWAKVVGTFSGGFQNRHSAFLYGEFSRTDKAHHYGFMENGVILTSPSDGLATIIVYKDGRINLKSWSEPDKQELHLMRHFRQNGVPLIERDPHGQGIPGQFVKFWGEGNWSGSADKVLRTPRGAVCLIENSSSKFLVYAYFSGATPSAMARVFQAYGCNYAVHLDMNSPAQAYAGVFFTNHEKSQYQIENLATSMGEGDVSGTPRYVVKPDYKDFFYIIKKEGSW